MKWMPKELQCTRCNRPMRVQLVDDNSSTFRKTEIRMCNVCGSPGMVKAVQEILDKNLQVASERIKVEEFTGY